MRKLSDFVNILNFIFNKEFIEQRFYLTKKVIVVPLLS